MVALFLAIVAVLELARRLPLFRAFHDMSACSQRTIRILRMSHVSEWGKERAMQLLSLKLMGASLKAGALLLAVAAPLLLVFGIEAAMGAHMHWQDRLFVLPWTLGYALLRWHALPLVLRRRVQPR